MKNFLIVGPTASGKTKLAIFLYKKYNIPIINMDTRQVWKNLKLITCSPSEQEKNEADHLLFNLLDNHEKSSLGWFVNKIKEIPGPKIIVGGSIFYALCLQNGIPMLNTPDYIKKHVFFMDNKYKYDYLKHLNPNMKIHSNDIYRLDRSLEFFLTTKTNFNDFSIKYKQDFFTIGINPPMEKLEYNIKLRIRNNINNWIEEVKLNYHENFLSVIGYSDCLAYLDGKIDKNLLIKLIFEKTLSYAKYQISFMKKLTLDKSISEVKDELCF